MTAIIILSIIAAFIITLMLIRVGVIAVYEDDDLYLAFTIAGLSIPINKFIKRFSGERKEEKTSKSKKLKSKEKKESTAPPFNKLIPIILEVLDKLRKGLKISELTAHVTIGGDPYSAAMLCGSLNELVGIFYPAAIRFLNIKKADILIMPNFTAESISITAKLRLSFRIGTLIRAALSAAVQYLNIRKEYKNGKTSFRRPDGDGNAENPRDGRRKYHSGYTDHNT
jgi:hypothetical protein